MSSLTKLPIWQALQDHYAELKALHMRDLFAASADRQKQFSLVGAGLQLDYSRNRMTQQTIKLLCQLAETVDLQQHIDMLLSGGMVNQSEQRPALHTALRAPADQSIKVDGQDVMPAIQQQLTRMTDISETIRAGHWLGFSSKAITDVVNIGIGGSDLGPKLVCNVLKPYADKSIGVHFVSNADASHLLDTLEVLNPETTLFIISSKSFSTVETLLNARSAMQWLGSNDRVKTNMLAVTANEAKALEFGIAKENILTIWDWVGGRYSLWSAIGLPIAISIGMDNFREFLAGAHAMDEHFQKTPFASNIPVVMALLGIWYINFFGAQTHAILPYHQHLRYLPDHIKQLDMESNGKSIRQDGEAVDYATGPIIWGQVGCNSQHAFHQLLHQGTHLIPVDFILPLQSHHQLAEHQQLMIANCLSQAQALMQGNNETNNDEHKTVAGNNPSNLIIIDKLTPFNLGALLATYEHKVFVQGVIWGINSFDQWGIELGKQLSQQYQANVATAIQPYLSKDYS